MIGNRIPRLEFGISFASHISQFGFEFVSDRILAPARHRRPAFRGFAIFHFVKNRE